MSISLIVAMSRNRVIGKDNKLPWHLPADLAFFKKTTMGHTIVMGRKTYESIGKPLPGRKNVILTGNPRFSAAGCTVIHSVEDALRLAQEEELFVIGGAEVFRLFFAVADKIYLTLLHHDIEGDTYFPEFSPHEWELIGETPGITDEKNPYSYSFQLHRRSLV